jgi:PAS domain S-box-containing protein
VLGGKVIGTVVIQVKAEKLLSIAQDYTGLGESGETVIAKRDEQGNAVFLTPLRFDRNAALRRHLSRKMSDAPIVRSLQGREIFITDGTDYRGQAVFSACRYLAESGIGLSVKIDRKEACAPLYAFQWKMAKIIAVCLLAIFLVVYRISHSLSQPIVQLTHKAANISGSLLTLSSSGRENEIGTLERTFESMVASLRAAHEGLENEVKQRTRELAQALHFNERVVAASPVGILVYEAGGRCILANEAAAAIIGAPREKLLEQDIRKIPAWKISGRLDAADEALRTGQEVHREFHLTTSFGKEAWLDYRMHRFEFRNHPHLLVVVDDMTERRKAEEAVRLNEARLNSLYQLSCFPIERSENEILEFALEEAVKLTGSQIGYLHFVNEDQSTIQLASWSREALKACTAVKEPHYPIEKAGVWADCARLKKPVIHNDYQNLPNRKGYPEGHSHLVRHLSIPVMENDRVVMIAGVGNKEFLYDDQDVRLLELIMRDLWRILKRKRAEEMMRQAREMAESANRAKSEFLANMSHEIRTPLNAVTGFSELLSSMVSEPTQRDYLEGIKTAGKSLLTLINDILDLSKIEAGMLEIQQAPVDLKSLLTEIQQVFRLKATDKGLQFLVEIDGSLPSILRLDEIRVRQILLNLVGNAIKFTEKGRIRIAARALTPASHGSLDLAITVEDTGIGIPKSDQEFIFEAFRQQSGQITRQYGGSGLGLTISRRLAGIMNGKIMVSSEHGKGSTFELQLHRVGIESPLPKTSRSTHLRLQDVVFDKATVLVVDDVDSNRKVLKEMLLRARLDVVEARNGKEAVRVAEQAKPALVLMDLRMEGMDGYEATQTIHQRPHLENVPIIAVTASSTMQDTHRMAQAGILSCLSKPLNSAQLLVELCRYLPHRKQDAPRSAPPPHASLKIESSLEPDALARILKEELLPQATGLSGAVKMSAVRLFGARLKEVGDRHRCAALKSYGEQISSAAESYQMAVIERLLKDFSVTAMNFMREEREAP